MQGRSFATKFATMQQLLLKSIHGNLALISCPFLLFLTNKNACRMFSVSRMDRAVTRFCIQSLHYVWWCCVMSMGHPNPKHSETWNWSPAELFTRTSLHAPHKKLYLDMIVGIHLICRDIPMVCVSITEITSLTCIQLRFLWAHDRTLAFLFCNTS